MSFHRVCCCSTPKPTGLVEVDPCIAFLPNRCVEPPPLSSTGDIVFYRESGSVYRCGELTDIPCSSANSDAFSGIYEDCSECQSLTCQEECELVCNGDPQAQLLGTFTAIGSIDYERINNCVQSGTVAFSISRSLVYVPFDPATPDCGFGVAAGQDRTGCTLLFEDDCPGGSSDVYRVRVETLHPSQLVYDCSDSRWEARTGFTTEPLRFFAASGIESSGTAFGCDSALGVSAFRRGTPTLAGDYDECAVGSYSGLNTSQDLNVVSGNNEITVTFTSYSFVVTAV